MLMGSLRRLHGLRLQGPITKSSQQVLQVGEGYVCLVKADIQPAGGPVEDV